MKISKIIKLVKSLISKDLEHHKRMWSDKITKIELLSEELEQITERIKSNTVPKASKPVIELRGKDEKDKTGITNIQCEINYMSSTRAETLVTYLCILRDAGVIDLMPCEYCLNNFYALQR